MFGRIYILGLSIMIGPDLDPNCLHSKSSNISQAERSNNKEY